MDTGIVKKISSGHCTCVKGNAVCHHMIALLMHAHYHLSPTDVTCMWNKPAQRQDKNTGSTVDELFPASKPNYQAISSPLSPSHFEFAYRCSGMCGEGAASAIWLISPSPPVETNPSLKSIKDFIAGDAFKEATDKKSALLTYMKVTSEEINNIAHATTGQNTNDLWLIARLFRITASVFGDCIKCMEKGRKPCKSLLENFFKAAVRAHKPASRRPANKGEGQHARQWGHDNEPTALRTFMDVTGLKVEPTGLWLHPSGKLGASPDGLVGHDAIVEVKCPFSLRKETSLAGSINKMKDYILQYEEITDEWQVNEGHEYYHQIQGQLYLRKVCYLIVWIPEDFHIAEICRDASWEIHIPQLLSFFDMYILPKLLENK